MRMVITVLAMAATIAVALACTSQPDAAAAPQPSAADTAVATAQDEVLQVVTTVSPITSIVENIGGTRIRLQGIVPEGVNSHTFEPAPSVATVLANADLVILNGLFLEEPTLELAEANLKSGAAIVSLGDESIGRDQWKFDFWFPEAQGYPNPHLWPDPILALRYAEVVRQTLSDRDAENGDYYAANYDAFAARIAILDGAIKTAVATVPPPNRKLLTYHDSWAYFADRYGMTVIGAVHPSDFSEPSAQEVAGLIEQIRDAGIPAIFGSNVFPSDVMRVIADESGAAYIDDLSDDDLPGKPGDALHSYLGLVVNNLRIMIPALGGDAAALDAVDVGPVFDGPATAGYPQ